jgi:hypothetical protein
MEGKWKKKWGDGDGIASVFLSSVHPEVNKSIANPPTRQPTNPSHRHHTQHAQRRSANPNGRFFYFFEIQNSKFKQSISLFHN